MSTSPFKSDSFELDESCNVCESLGSTRPDALRAKTAHPATWQQEPAPDIVRIGRAGWTTLHTMAAYYPDAPTTQDKSAAVALLSSFARLFPCKWCADDFAEYMIANPPEVSSRQQLGSWMCNAHNQVNQNLGKPLFDCTQIDRRWRKHVSSDLKADSSKK